MIFRNLKTRRTYVVIAHACDATNSRDGTPVVVYAPARWRARLAAWLLRDEQVFVRESLEFAGKFGRRA